MQRAASPFVLPQDFYLQPTLTVARELLGKIFVHIAQQGVLKGRIVEVEAYHGATDEASHGFKGKTARNEVMFRQGGFLYVYFTYGMHFCMNVVTEAEGVGAAILLRGIEPLEGLEVIQHNRGANIQLYQLTSGPAKCCQAFGIGRVHNGASLFGPEIRMEGAPRIPDAHIQKTTRIGITRSRALVWRFFEQGNPFVSRTRPALAE